MTWWVMWQCIAQSPGSSATNSIVRVLPTGTSTVVSGHCADSGIAPPSVSVTSELDSRAGGSGGGPSALRLPMRMRTRSPVFTTSGVGAGERLGVDRQHVEVGHLVRVGPLGARRRCATRAAAGRSRDRLGGRGSARGWMTNSPVMPSPSASSRRGGSGTCTCPPGAA